MPMPSSPIRASPCRIVALGDAEATTAIQAVRDWRPDFGRLAAAATLADGIRDGSVDLDSAEVELDRIVTMEPPYPRWLRFAAPALLSGAVTIVFGGNVLDALATFLIGLAIQPALERIERSALPLFFQVVFGVAATTLLAVLLVGLGLPIDGGLVLTGGLLRFLPGAQLVAGMRDLIAGAIVSGAANLAQVDGRVGWPAVVTVAAGGAAVAAYCVRLGVPRRVVLSAAILGGVAVAISNGFGPVSLGLDHDTRTLVAALVIGVASRVLAGRSDAPSALWIVPAILPLLPAPATLLPFLAESEAVQLALQGQALTTAFLIGIGVASGDILVSTYQRYREGALAG
jgi:uncharacterized membrane protein YjjP (DUF1212 family)/uncharacterized membrane protein YjjB (DUF3815 family)